MLDAQQYNSPTEGPRLTLDLTPIAFYCSLRCVLNINVPFYILRGKEAHNGVQLLLYCITSMNEIRRMIWSLADTLVGCWLVEVVNGLKIRHAHVCFLAWLCNTKLSVWFSHCSTLYSVQNLKK